MLLKFSGYFCFCPHVHYLQLIYSSIRVFLSSFVSKIITDVVNKLFLKIDYTKCNKYICRAYIISCNNLCQCEADI